jgi:hypothetical protein
MSAYAADVCHGFFMLLALVTIVVGVCHCHAGTAKCQAECLRSYRTADDCRVGCS